jgi:hypothetical protein
MELGKFDQFELSAIHVRTSILCYNGILRNIDGSIRRHDNEVTRLGLGGPDQENGSVRNGTDPK